VDAGEVSLIDGGLVFPEGLTTGPGLYRLRLTGTGDTRVYVGEASAIRRRASHYRIGHESGATNARINALLRRQLADGGSVRMAIAVRGWLTVGGRTRQADFRDRSTRVLAESAALLSVPEGHVVINRRGALGDLATGA
jgi:hypothetical protein